MRISALFLFLTLSSFKTAWSLPEHKDGSGFIAAKFFNASRDTIEQRILRISDDCPTTLDPQTKAKFIAAFDKAEPIFEKAMNDGKGYWKAVLKMCQELTESLKDSVKTYDCSEKTLKWTAPFRTLSQDIRAASRYWGAVNSFYETALDEGFTTTYGGTLPKQSPDCRRTVQNSYENLLKLMKYKSYDANAMLLTISNKMDKKFDQVIDEANAMRLTDRPTFLAVYDNCKEALDASEFDNYFLKEVKQKLDSCKQ